MMKRWIAAAFSVAMVSMGGVAHAEGGAISVMGVINRDHDRHADALTDAVRAAIASTPGYTNVEPPTSLGVLTVALKCPPVPDTSCLIRVGDQVRMTRYFWIIQEPQSAPGTVSFAVHLFEIGKQDLSSVQTLPEAFNEESIRVAAKKVIQKLLLQEGTLKVTATKRDASVLIDGKESGKLVMGRFTKQLKAGEHTVEVVTPAGTSSKRRVRIASGDEAEEAFTLATDALRAEDPRQDTVVTTTQSSSSLRPAVAIGLIAVGAIGIGVGTFGLVKYSSLKSEGNDIFNTQKAAGNFAPFPEGGDPCTDLHMKDPSAHDYAADVCSRNSDSKTFSTVGIIGLAIGGAALITGVVLLATSHGKSTVAPMLGKGLYGSSLSLEF